MITDSSMNPDSYVNYGIGGKVDEPSWRDIIRDYYGLHLGHWVIPSLLLLTSAVALTSSCYDVKQREVSTRPAKKSSEEPYQGVKIKKYGDMSQAERDKLAEILNSEKVLRRARELLDSIDATVEPNQP